MPRPCTICTHKRRAEIETAAQHGLTESSIRRHLADHLPQALVKAEEARCQADAESLLEKVFRIERDARHLLTRAEKTGDLRCAIAAAKTSLDVVELLLKIREAEKVPADRVDVNAAILEAHRIATGYRATT